MAQYVAISAIDAVIGGVEVTIGAGYVELKDSATGYDGPGSYHIQLQRSTGKYIVTAGLPPGDSSDLLRICRAIQTPAGAVALHDIRAVNVNALGVNLTIMQTEIDGSYLANDVIVPRNFAVGTFEALLDAIGDTQGDILYRSATAWAVLPPGTAGYVLTTGGDGENPEWTEVGSGGSGVTSVNGETGVVDLESTDGSIAITEPDAHHINLEVDLAGNQYGPVLPMVNGDTPPALMYDSHGSLIYFYLFGSP